LQISKSSLFSTFFFDQPVGYTNTFPVPGFSDNGTEYFWRVKAHNYIGDTLSSPTYHSFANGELPKPNPTAPAAGITVAGTSLTFAWSAVPEATSYVIEVSRDPDFSSIVNTGIATGTTGTVSGFDNVGHDYYWRVAARNGGGLYVGHYSDALKFTNGSLSTSLENSETCSWSPSGSSTNTASGVLSHDQELFALKGGVVPVVFSLFYISLPQYTGPLGPGWSHSYDYLLKEDSTGSVTLRDGSGSRTYYAKSAGGYVSPKGDFSTLAKNPDNTIVVRHRDGSSYNFNSSGKLTSIVDRFNNSLTLAYTNGDLTSITDPSQRVISIAYDQSTTPHRISSVTDTKQNVYDFEYLGITLYKVKNPAIATPTGPQRGYWEYLYHPNKLLKSKQDPNGNLTQYKYYADLRMETATDPEGALDPTGHARTFVYPAITDNPKKTKFMEKDGGEWFYTYDLDKGVLKQKEDPNGKLATYTYYTNGNLKSTTVPKDGAVRLTTFYTYDIYGHILTQTAPTDLSTYSIDPETVDDPSSLTAVKPVIRYAYDYNNNDRVTSVSDESETIPITTTLVYSTENGGEVITSTTTPGNYVSITKKNPNGTLREVVDANGKTTSLTYHPDTTANRTAGIVGLLSTVTYPSGVAITVSSYDKNGNALEIAAKDKNGAVRLTTTQQHNALNHLNQLTKTATIETVVTNIVTAYGYDLVGNVNSSIDAEARNTKYEYNYNKQIKKITDAKLNDTIFTYSGSGCSSCGSGVDKLTGVYDASATKKTPIESQPHTSFSYDRMGRVEYEADQVGKKMRYTYYDSGQLKEKYDATNDTSGTLLVTFIYNHSGKLTDKIFTDNTSEHFTYYPSGKLWTASNQNISYTYNYYTDGRLKSVVDTTNGRTISYDEYDNLGQRKQVTVLKGAGTDERVIKYDYDTANRLWHITSSAGIFTYDYDELSRRSSITYPNQTTVSYGFDDLNRLISIYNKVTNGATFAGVNYTEFDKVGNRKAVTGTKSATYGYDDLYRLGTVTTGKPEGIEYDPVGNRENGPTPDDTVYKTNEANQMTKGRKLSYLYDNFGNQTTRTVADSSDKSWVQSWNYENQLVKVEKVKGGEKRTVTFTYDPFGRRIGKQMNTVIDGITKTQTWSYLYDGDSIAVESYTDENNQATKSFYTQGLEVDEHLALERSGKHYYYHADGLGSIVAITDSVPTVVQSYEYDSYGMLTPSTSFRNGYVYTGREWDKETGLYYYRARYYDPMEGRFISRDPIGLGGGDVNFYAYVKNRPTSLVDPFGLEPPPNVPPGISIPSNVEEAKNMTPVQFYDAVKSRGEWDYKRLDREKYQDFGNYHYGVVGAANGWSTDVLLRAAGAYQIYSRTSTDKWGRPWGSSPYGDDPNDQKWILEGIKDYKAGRYGKGCSGGW